MRFSLALGVLCCLASHLGTTTSKSFAQEVAGEDPLQSEKDEIRDFFKGVEKASRLDDATDLVDFYDITAFGDRVIELADVELPVGFRQIFIGQSRARLKQQFELLKDRWIRHRITYMQVSDGGTLAEVVLRHWSEDLRNTRTLFILEKTESWKIVDWTDLSLGLNATQVTAAILRDGMESNMPQDLANSAKVLLQAMVQTMEEDFYSGSETLEKLVGRRVPPPMESLRWCLTAANALVMDPLYASECVEKISAFDERALIADYLRLMISLELGQSDLVIEHAELFLDRYGADADAYYAIGLAYRDQDRIELAIKAFQAGLTDTPESSELVEGYALALPADRKQEFTKHFLALPEPMSQFEFLADSFELEEDGPALQALIDAADSLEAPIPYRRYYQSVVLLAQDQAGQAFDQLKEALGSLGQEEGYREYYESLLSVAAVESGRVLDAYELLEDKEAGFQSLMDALDREATDAKLEEVKQMTAKLIEQHAKSFEDNASFHQVLGNREYFADHIPKAIAYLRQALRHTDDPEKRQEIYSDLFYCHYEDESFLEFYRSTPDDDKSIVFDLIAYELDPFNEVFQQIDALHRVQFPMSARYRKEELVKRYQEGAYADALKICLNLIEGMDEESWDFDLTTYQVACLAHTGKFDDAIIRAREEEPGARDFLRCLVYAIKGKRELFLDAFKRSAESDFGYEVADVTRWVELPDAWTEEIDSLPPKELNAMFRSYADVRRVLFLLPRRQMINAFSVQRAARAAGLTLSEISRDELASNRTQYICELKPGTFLLADGEAKYYVSSGDRPYLGSGEALMEAALSPECVGAADVKAHQAWVSVEVFSWPQENQEESGAIPDRATQTLSDLARHLVSETATVAIHADNWTTANCDETFYEQLPIQKAEAFGLEDAAVEETER